MLVSDAQIRQLKGNKPSRTGYPISACGTTITLIEILNQPVECERVGALAGLVGDLVF